MSTTIPDRGDLARLAKAQICAVIDSFDDLDGKTQRTVCRALAEALGDLSMTGDGTVARIMSGALQ